VCLKLYSLIEIKYLGLVLKVNLDRVGRQAKRVPEKAESRPSNNRVNRVTAKHVPEKAELTSDPPINRRPIYGMPARLLVGTVCLTWICCIEGVTSVMCQESREPLFRLRDFEGCGDLCG
jgi:hypothetical protein